MTDKNNQTPSREKLYFFSLLGLAVLVSLILELGFYYQGYALIAFTHLAFYQALFGKIVLLVAVPYLIAYGLGRLLTLISYVLRGNQNFNHQFFVAWILFVVFSYYLATLALVKHQNLSLMIARCTAVETKDKHISAIQLSHVDTACANKMIELFPPLHQCMLLNALQKRQACIKTVLK